MICQQSETLSFLEQRSPHSQAIFQGAVDTKLRPQMSI